jgi:Helix-turn-helix domain
MQVRRLPIPEFARKYRENEHPGLIPSREPLMDEGGAAAYLGLTPRAMQAYRYRGDGPEFIRLSGRAIRYALTDLDAWVASRKFRCTSEYYE